MGTEEHFPGGKESKLRAVPQQSCTADVRTPLQPLLCFMLVTLPLLQLLK